MLEYFSRKIKNFDVWDIGFTKLSVAAFVLFVVSFLSSYIGKIVAMRWIWFALFVLFMIRPLIKVFGKEKTNVKKNKKAAIEMSIGTIVVIVIAITMLVFGIVFVRNIMCSAITLTSGLSDNVQGEITKLFGATGSEVQCIGGGGEPVAFIPGKINIIYCGIKAKATAQYSIEVTSIKDGNSITEDMLQSWIVGGEDSWEGNVAPGDDLPKKILRLQIPENAPEDNIIVSIEAKKNGEVISSQDLDFVTKRTGFIKSAMC